MAGLKLGSLFSGYGGLEMAVEAVLGTETAWVSDIDKGACKILAHRYPDVPNLGDITAIDWSTVEPVDVITGGSPCQDLSHAGKRGGMTAGTRSNLWVAMREAIAQLRPSLVVWENVRGAYSAAADSDVEPCAGCVGDGSGVSLRALHRVLGDLSDLGYDCRWHGLRAADVGAPHGRFRVFVVAHLADAERIGRQRWTATLGDLAGVGSTSSQPDGLAAPALLPTPTSSDTNGAGAHGDGGLDLRTALTLLPTPAVNDMGEGKTVDAWDEWTATMQARHGNGNGHGKSLSIEAQRLLPTPRAGDGEKGGPNQASSSGGLMLPSAVQPNRWGDYAEAIARWEHLTRPAPAPTMQSKKGTPQLSPAFSEWMMGLPAGWVTDVPDITRNEALRALGNGVVPQQAEAALRFLLSAASVGVAS